MRLAILNKRWAGNAAWLERTTRRTHSETRRWALELLSASLKTLTRDTLLPMNAALELKQIRRKAEESGFCHSFNPCRPLRPSRSLHRSVLLGREKGVSFWRLCFCAGNALSLRRGTPSSAKPRLARPFSPPGTRQDRSSQRVERGELGPISALEAQLNRCLLGRRRRALSVVHCVDSFTWGSNE
jgi:hypothetical protein